MASTGESNKLIFSLAAGVIATLLLYSYSQEKKAEYDNKYGKTKRVVKAKEDISEMSTIYDNMVDTEEVPETFVQPGAISTGDEAIGSVAAVPIKKGQVIVKNALLTPGPDTGLANQVAPSKRAVTIAVDETRAVAKLIRPGDRVDIFAAVDTGKGANQKRELVLMMSDVIILATGTNVQNNIPRTVELDASGKQTILTPLTGDTRYNNITVEADPKQAQDLFYLSATSAGNIFFALRNPNDRSPAPQMPSTTGETLTFGKTAYAPPPVISSPAPASVAPPVPVAVPAAPAPAAQKPKTNGFRTL